MTHPPVPVTVISGYLGAGKTTLVNRLLADAQGRRITVLVNDFGEIAIDEALILNRSGDTVALANGCMCCSVGGGVYEAIDKILRAPALPDHIVIETSGVADPAKIEQIAVAEPDLVSYGVVTLIDALNLDAQLADPLLADTVERQIAGAALLVLSKADLCDAAVLSSVEAQVEAFSARIPRLLGGHVAVPTELILDDLRADKASPADTGHHHHHAHDHGSLYASWASTGKGAPSAEALERFVARDDLGIVRLKGFVRLGDDALMEVHRAGRFQRIATAEDRGQASRLVAIGPAARFDAARVQKAWEEAR